ncbi:MAG: hypothetical protein LBR81_06980 [Prevotellaceae bacterium]|nr:hypothetical protein [Prevotellaceae bacterium]
MTQKNANFRKYNYRTGRMQYAPTPNARVAAGDTPRRFQLSTFNFPLSTN